MICGFKQMFPSGEPTYFREKILIGVDHPEVKAYSFGNKGIEVIPFGNKGTREYTIWETFPGQGFVKTDKLILKPKLTTIRIGNRWKVGDKIHMATGVRTKDYNQFNKGIPELETVKSVQTVKIITDKYTMRQIYIDGLHFNHNRNFEALTINDGFSGLGQFWLWFDKDFEGQIIHWTDLRY